jgi:hypothetical protein
MISFEETKGILFCMYMIDKMKMKKTIELKHYQLKKTKIKLTNPINLDGTNQSSLLLLNRQKYHV